MTVNVVWLIQVKTNTSGWVTQSVWGDAVEAEKYLESISHRFSQYEKRVYGVPCYGELAKFLGERGWAERVSEEDE
jgi:hypothetical protein